MTDLAALVAAAATARKKCEALAAQLSDLQKQVAPSEQALEAADAELAEVLGREILGETTDKQVKAARASRDDARDRLAGLRAAIKVVADRCDKSANELEATEEAAREQTRPIAEELAATALDEAQEHARAFAESLARWHRYDAASRGAYLTGATQQRFHGCLDVLRAHGFRGVEMLQLGHPEGDDPLPTPSEILAAVPRKVRAA